MTDSVSMGESFLANTDVLANATVTLKFSVEDFCLTLKMALHHGSPEELEGFSYTMGGFAPHLNKTDTFCDKNGIGEGCFATKMNRISTRIFLNLHHKLLKISCRCRSENSLLLSLHFA